MGKNALKILISYHVRDSRSLRKANWSWAIRSFSLSISSDVVCMSRGFPSGALFFCVLWNFLFLCVTHGNPLLKHNEHEIKSEFHTQGQYGCSVMLPWPITLWTRRAVSTPNFLFHNKSLGMHHQLKWMSLLNLTFTTRRGSKSWRLQQGRMIAWSNQRIF